MDELLALLIKYSNNDLFLSRFYGLICMIPGHYYILASEGNARLELISWLNRN